MMHRTAVGILAPALLLVGFAQSANAQVGPFAIGGRASTLGLGVEAAARIKGPLAIRVGLQSYTYDRDEEVEGIPYSIHAKLSGTPLLVELHPGNGSFYLTAGMVLKTPQVTLDAVNTGSIDIGDETYTSSQVSRLDGSIRGKKNAPYVGLGFDKAVFTKGRIAFGFELGVAMIGAPEPTLTVTSTLSGAQLATLNQNLEDELQEIRNGIADAPAGGKLFPVLGFSLKIRM